ncbi:MAG: FMN-binding negative transcriptional regulator [Chitinophagia bacterium]|nr:FMN-binding negative transcriptional regulator [Chitinophagia bacterium]
MYIPAFNRVTDDDEVVDFMRRYAFATIVTAKDGLPTATHLPFSVDRRGEDLFLTSHFAKANAQWMELASHKALVIFSEPHAYISPRHYDHSTNVPTWNYISVHAYGYGRLLTDPSEALRALEGMIDTYEAGYRSQWDALPEDYRMKMLKGIVAFEVKVSELQAKKKLSQNRSEAERDRIINALSASSDTNETAIAAFMERDRRKD